MLTVGNRPPRLGPHTSSTTGEGMTMRRVRGLLVLIVGLLPASAIKNRLLNLLGHDIHPTAMISPILIRNVGRITAEEHVRINLGNTLQTSGPLASVPTPSSARGTSSGRTSGSAGTRRPIPSGSASSPSASTP